MKGKRHMTEDMIRISREVNPCSVTVTGRRVNPAAILGRLIAIGARVNALLSEWGVRSQRL